MKRCRFFHFLFSPTQVYERRHLFKAGGGVDVTSLNGNLLHAHVTSLIVRFEIYGFVFFFLTESCEYFFIS